LKVSDCKYPIAQYAMWSLRSIFFYDTSETISNLVLIPLALLRHVC